MNYTRLSDRELAQVLDGLYARLATAPAADSRDQIIGEVQAVRHEVYKRANPLDYPAAVGA